MNSIYDFDGNPLVTSSENRFKNIIVPDNGIFRTTSLLFGAYDQFVTDGFATSSQISIVNDVPMYRYDFTAYNKWASGGANLEDTSGNRMYNKKQVLFFSGQHGDEKGSVLWLYEFMKKVCYDPAYSWILSIFDIHVVPIGNPVGYNNNTRLNGDGININRLDESSETNEAIALMAEVNKMKYDLFIDFHNTPTDGKVGQNNNYAPNVTGVFSLANGMPEEQIIENCELYLYSVTELSQLFYDYFGITDARTQNFFPWQGTTLHTFRNYGYLHEVNGEIVGAPISACFEMSYYCKTYSYSLTAWNNTTLIIGNSILNSVAWNFLKKVANIKI